MLCVTLLSWLQTNQPDLFTRDSAKRRGIRFKTRPNTDGTTHLTVSLRLTERQRVREENQTLHVTYLPEPPPPEPVTRPTALYINGEWVSTWAS
ncbi:phage tail protein [Musicola paradisiaca]|uniref:phage tail protein n=1 Tax=Musicola paradisiaca TaxID=69223 RepID=UPI000B0C40CD|nr:phage tail protein [Musicola paradisiaca]